MQSPFMQQQQPKPGDLTRDEIRAHLALGRSVIMSPRFAKDEDGNLVQTRPPAHIVHPSQIEAMPELRLKPLTPTVSAETSTAPQTGEDANAKADLAAKTKAKVEEDAKKAK